MLRLLLLICLLATPVRAQDGAAMMVENARIVVVSPVARSAGGYLEVTNTGTTPDRLLAVELDLPQVAFHESVVEDGIARMEPRPDGFVVGPGETLSLARGGRHLMIAGLTGPLEDGATYDGVLIFEAAGRVPALFTVTSTMAGDGGHAGH